MDAPFDTNADVAAGRGGELSVVVIALALAARRLAPILCAPVGVAHR